MRVRVWNVYASNNSGSYTIVGELPSKEVAHEVARELAEMIDAHTTWLDNSDGTADTAASPLAAFCRAHSLTWTPGMGQFDDWPEHSRDNRPRVAAVGEQVIVHHEYTVGLPPTFGEFFYRKGGRVTHEECHAHHAIVTEVDFYWGWTDEQRAKMAAELPRLVMELTRPDGFLATGAPAMWPAAWRTGDGLHHAPFTVGVLFPDLLAGVSALRSAGEGHGASMRVRLREAPDDLHDPLAHLRPSSPPPEVPRFDVVLVDTGGHRPSVVTALAESLGLCEGPIRHLLLKLPATVAQSLTAPRAEAVAGRVRRAGAVVELMRNDG